MRDAVYDCMVFLQGAARPSGPASACLLHAEARHVRLFLSPPILAEIRDVLTRQKIRRQFPILTPDYVDDLLHTLLRFSTVITDVPTVFRHARDPKDEPYINLAIAADAEDLVSRDNDLLDLMDRRTGGGADFRRRFPGLTILTPVSFLRLLSAEEESL